MNGKAKFKESRPLRELLFERLQKQRQCVDQLIERYEDYEAAFQAGQASDSKGPGDEQISGEQVEMIKRQVAGLARGSMGGDAERLAMMRIIARGEIGSRLPPAGYGMRKFLMQRWDPYGTTESASPFPQHNLSPTGHDPEEGWLERYLRLDNEIRLLVNLSTVPSNERNPYRLQADRWELTTHPHKALAKLLPRLLGDGKRVPSRHTAPNTASSSLISTPSGGTRTPLLPQMQRMPVPQS